MPAPDMPCFYCGHRYEQHEQTVTPADCDVKGCDCIGFDEEDRG